MSDLLAFLVLSVMALAITRLYGWRGLLPGVALLFAAWAQIVGAGGLPELLFGAGS